MTEHEETGDRLDDVAATEVPETARTILERGDKISQKDKSALIALIKMHFKIVLEEITAEEQRALAEVAARVSKKRQEEARQADSFKTALTRVITLTNERIDSLVDEHTELFGPGGRWRRPHRISDPSVYQSTSTDSAAMQQALTSKIRSRATDARLKVRREETNLLRAVQIAVLTSRVALDAVAALPGREQIFTTDDILQLEATPVPVDEVFV